MALIDNAKLVLRLKSDAFDDELQGLIDAAIADLKAAGINTEDTTNARIKQAVMLYCKANFGVDNASGERFRTSYETLRIALALDGGDPVVE